MAAAISTPTQEEWSMHMPAGFLFLLLLFHLGPSLLDGAAHIQGGCFPLSGSPTC
jgi:hypothetical protein